MKQGAFAVQARSDVGKHILVQDAHVERLMPAPGASTGLPQFDLDHRIRPRVPWAQPERCPQHTADAPLHDVPMDEGPQLPHFLHGQLQRAGRHQNTGEPVPQRHA